MNASNGCIYGVNIKNALPGWILNLMETYVQDQISTRKL